MLITVDGQSAVRLLRIYGISAPVTDERFAAHHDPRTGIPVTIDGIVDPQTGPSMRLKISGKRASRIVPLDESGAQALLTQFHEEKLLAPDAKNDLTLVHLLLKCSKLYLDSGLSELHLLLYLTPQGYRTHAVYMLRTRNIAPRRRVVAT